MPVAACQIGGAAVLGVDARNVWALLGSGLQFIDWLALEAIKCSFEEGIDYQETVFRRSPRSSGRGRRRRDYVMTLRAAKHVCMADTGLRGAELRDYFVECERRLLGEFQASGGC